jgi:subtilisin family serine protease
MFDKPGRRLSVWRHEGAGVKRVLAASLAVFILGQPSQAQEALLDDLLRENTLLKAEIATLRAEAVGQCAAAGTAVDPSVTLLMQKLSQAQDDAALAALGPPQSPIVLPDSVLQSLVPNQYVLTLANGQTAGSPETIAAEFGLRPDQVLFTYSRVLIGFSAILDPADLARLAADPRISAVEQDGFVFPAQEGAALPAQTEGPAAPLLSPSADLVDVYVFDSGIRAGHRALSGLVGQGFTSFRNAIGTEDCNGHGTHVAGSIGGRQFGQTGRARLISVKVLDRDSYGDVSTVIAGVEWVLAQPGASKIANMSLTRLDPAPPGQALLDRAVMALITAGIPVVVAAGNSAADARLYSPARIAAAITVGAMSNTGEGVDIYVQGADVPSASLTDSCGFERMSGTSMAAARVTGAAADLLADGTDAQDVLSGLLARSSLQETGNFTGEVTRFVLGLREGDLAGFCDGKAIEINAEKRP